MKQYLELCRNVMKNGSFKDDRTKVGTISYFGYQCRYDLSLGFPLLTTKKIHFKSVLYELLWFIKGDTNIKYLVDHDVRIWNEWPYQKYQQSKEYQGETMDEFIFRIKNDDDFSRVHGQLGPVYGKQWRSFGATGEAGFDQLSWLISEIKNNPSSRRLILNAWNVNAIEEMLLPPCHLLAQFYVVNNKLSCQLYQRSADVFLGVPFNIASYALLTMMIAKVCNLEVGEFIHSIGDCHIYKDHLPSVEKQLGRRPRTLPKLVIKRVPDTIFDFDFNDFELIDYNPHSGLKGKVAV